MKAAVLCIFALLIGGCASTSLPAPYAGPTAILSDYIEQESSSKAHVFAVVEVDGQKVVSSIGRTRQATQGKGFRLDGRIVSREVPARRVELKITAQTVFAAEILALFGKSFYVEGKVSFEAQAGASYMVKGVLRQDECAIWVQDLASRRIVSDIVVLKKDA